MNDNWTPTNDDVSRDISALRQLVRSLQDDLDTLKKDFEALSNDVSDHLNEHKETNP